MFNLPSEIVINILSYCKVLPLTYVSRQFNDLISNTPCLMKKVNLLINERTNFSEIIKSKRKHQNVLIKFNYKIDKSILEVFRVFGHQIKSLELMRCIMNEDLFIELLDYLPNLETLSIYTTYLKNDFQFSIELVQPAKCLNKLKSFNFRNSDQKFLKILKNTTSIKSINFSLPHQYHVSLITEFLKNYQNVEIIESLMVSEVEKSILVLILCDMKNLKKLCLEIDKIKMDEIRSLEIENTSIEFLNLYGSPLDPVDFNKILSFFKNVKQFEIEINSILDPINMVQLNTHNKIESLKIMNCYGDFFDHIRLSGLKSFEIFDVSSLTLDSWTNFAQRNPQIETLIIKDEAVTDEIFMTITQDFRNLKYLEIFYDPQRLTNDILNYICDPLFPRNIRTLKIRKRQWQQYSNSFFTLTDNHKNILDKCLGFNLILR